MKNSVILVDDDQDHLDLLKLAFKQFDPALSCISFVYADDAQKALANFSELPRCILIDFNLPRKEGIDCLYELRKNKRFDIVPIGVYAKNVSPIIKEALEEAGANLVFQKPAKLSDYHSIMSLLLDRENDNIRKLNKK
jgi:CheY-like chemotaxis protein